MSSTSRRRHWRGPVNRHRELVIGKSVKWERKRISHESIFAISMELIGMFARRVWLRQHKFDISLSRIDYRSLESRSGNLPASRYRPPGRHHLWQPHQFFESFSSLAGETHAIALAHTNDDCEIQSTRFMQRDSSRLSLGNASFNWTRNYSARLDFPDPKIHFSLRDGKIQLNDDFSEDSPWTLKLCRRLFTSLPFPCKISSLS